MLQVGLVTEAVEKGRFNEGPIRRSGESLESDLFRDYREIRATLAYFEANGAEFLCCRDCVAERAVWHELFSGQIPC